MAEPPLPTPSSHPPPEFESFLTQANQELENIDITIQESRDLLENRSLETADLAPPRGAREPVEQHGEAGSTEHKEEALHKAEHTHHMLHTGENLAEQIFEHRHHTAASKELQWFYVEGTNRLGPVSQSRLLEMLDKEEISWSSLVWNKKLENWVKASDTELLDLTRRPAATAASSTIVVGKKTNAERAEM